MAVEKVTEGGEGLLFLFSLFKTVTFVLSLPKLVFSTGKRHFTPKKNQEK